MIEILKFLNANSGAIASVATVAGVIVAGVYTYYTTRLWQVAAAQAVSSAEQARISSAQLEAAREQLAEAKRMFRAVNRPWLELVASVEIHSAGPDTCSFLRVTAKNHGTVPATVMKVECGLHSSGGTIWGGPLLPLVVQPGGIENLGAGLLPAPPQPSEHEWQPHKMMRWLHFDVAYRGLDAEEFVIKEMVSVVPASGDEPAWELRSKTSLASEFWELHRTDSRDPTASSGHCPRLIRAPWISKTV